MRHLADRDRHYGVENLRGDAEFRVQRGFPFALEVCVRYSS
jgi:hypothetical protein